MMVEMPMGDGPLNPEARYRTAVRTAVVALDVAIRLLLDDPRYRAPTEFGEQVRCRARRLARLRRELEMDAGGVL